MPAAFPAVAAACCGPRSRSRSTVCADCSRRSRCHRRRCRPGRSTSCRAAAAWPGDSPPGSSPAPAGSPRARCKGTGCAAARASTCGVACRCSACERWTRAGNCSLPRTGCWRASRRWSWPMRRTRCACSAARRGPGSAAAGRSACGPDRIPPCRFRSQTAAMRCSWPTAGCCSAPPHSLATTIPRRAKPTTGTTWPPCSG